MKNTIDRPTAPAASNPDHHIWNNHGTWWCHFTVHHSDYTAERVRVSLRTRDLGSLESTTIEDFYADLVGDLGFETAAATTALERQDAQLAQLMEDRESVSGVNLQEEIANVIRFQQSYEAAARLMSVSKEMMDTLLNIAR
jgi:flagellar hook-associated protein FlgK